MNRRTLLSVVAIGVLAALIVPYLGGLGHRSLLEGSAAADFSLPIAAGQGDRVRLSDQRGKVVVLDFWASWCGPCRHSVPLMNRVAQRYAGKVHVYGINTESFLAETLAVIAKQWGITYVVLADPAAQTQLQYDVQVLPTVVVVDQHGVIRKVYPGEPTEFALDQEIQRLLR